MKKSSVIKLLIGAVLVLYPIGCWKIKYPTFVYKYKVTVEVDTPNGVKTGSSVVEVTTIHSPGWATNMTTSDLVTRTNIKGEGTMVDVADGKTLFVLLNDVPGISIPQALIQSAIPMPPLDKKDKYKVYPLGESDKFYARLKNAKGVLPRDKYPRIVYFEDINNPITVKEANPDDLSVFFGKGVKVKQIIVETTNDELEWKIWDRLKWLPEYYGKTRLDGKRYQGYESKDKFANSVGPSEFSIREK